MWIGKWDVFWSVVLVVGFIIWFAPIFVEFAEKVGEAHAIESYATFEFECKTELVRRK
jgi:hypothetical protein